MKYKNTLQRGSVRYIVFKEGGEWYAAGLEFNIVECGSTPQEAMLLLFDALQGYVESAKKVGALPTILNQKTDGEYENMWKTRAETNRSLSKPIFAFGQLNIAKSSMRSAVPA